LQPDSDDKPIGVECKKQPTGIAVTWDVVTVDCLENKYDLTYTGEVLWNDQIINDSKEDLVDTSYILETSSDFYEDYTSYTFFINTDFRSGNCSVTSKEGSE